MTEYHKILTFWFGDLLPDQFPNNKWELWFASKPQDDATINARFGNLINDAIDGNLDSWLSHPDGKMAVVLLCDQMTRATRRGQPTAFSGDSKAQQITLNGLQNGEDKHMHPAHRVFFYLPLEHSEDIALQNCSVQCYQNLLDDYPQHQAILERCVQEASEHRELIKQFGRFPHRNHALNRPNTDAETQYLQTTKKFYGQAPQSK